MNIGSYFDDEKLKLSNLQRCWYCGSREELSVDHLIARIEGGSHGGENLVPACRSCNSSKGSRDLLDWMAGRGEFPPLLVLRRYLKMAIIEARRLDLLEASLDILPGSEVYPFAVARIPRSFPPAPQLCLLPE